MEEYSVFQFIKVPTRIKSQSATLLDLMFSNVKHISYSGCIDFLVSDHFPTYIIKKRQKIIRVNGKVYSQSLKNMNWEQYRSKLLDIKWDDITTLDDINVMWSRLKVNLIRMVDDICPLKWMTITTYKPQWLTSKLTDLMEQRDRLFCIFRSGKKKLLDIYKKAVDKRREFNKQSKLARENFFREQLMLYRCDQSGFWRKVNELLGRQTESEIDFVFKYGTDFLLGTTESVEEVNGYFALVKERVSSEINDLGCDLLDDEVTDTEMSFFNPLTINRFLEIVAEVKLSKSSEIEGLNSRLLILAMKTRPDIFVEICNKSFLLGIFPDDCKRARISIIPKKKGDKRVLDNLRPISLLCLLGKIMEKHVKFEIS